MSDATVTTRRHAMRSVPQAARETDVPERALRRWVESGEIHAVRLGSAVLVDVGEVAEASARLLTEHDRRPAGVSPLGRRAIGGADVLAGLGGLTMAVAGPNDGLSVEGLLLALACLAVGIALLGGARPRRTAAGGRTRAVGQPHQPAPTLRLPAAAPPAASRSARPEQAIRRAGDAPPRRRRFEPSAESRIRIDHGTVPGDGEGFGTSP